MWPEQIGGMAIRAEVWPTAARNGVSARQGASPCRRPRPTGWVICSPTTGSQCLKSGGALRRRLRPNGQRLPPRPLPELGFPPFASDGRLLYSAPRELAFLSGDCESSLLYPFTAW